MQDHPSVREAAVVGLPDERLGQVPVAAYVARAGQPAPEEAQLREFLRGSLMATQIPVRMFPVEELPRTPSLKVSQPELKDLLARLMRL
jgi:acyl-CoA synthetase (AMP-forming)/AMP-acid ligase II